MSGFGVKPIAGNQVIVEGKQPVFDLLVRHVSLACDDDRIVCCGTVESRMNCSGPVRADEGLTGISTAVQDIVDYLQWWFIGRTVAGDDQRVGMSLSGTAQEWALAGISVGGRPYDTDKATGGDLPYRF